MLLPILKLLVGGDPLGPQEHHVIGKIRISPSPYPLGGSFLDYSHMVAKLKLKVINDH